MDESNRLIFGGSFNPLHIGHLRLAINVKEMMASFLEEVDFVPAHIPPHKNIKGLLPFKLRVEIIRCALSTMAHMNCCELEGESSGPSYTFDTLRRYHDLYPHATFYFMLGSQDFALLPEWHKGLELPSFANIVVVPRGTFTLENFLGLIKNFWGTYLVDKENGSKILYSAGNALCVCINKGSRIFYLPAPYLDISASMIRSLWRNGRSIAWLVPTDVPCLLEKNKKIVAEYWQEKTCSMYHQKI